MVVIADGCIDVIGRIDQTRHFMMITAESGVFLEKQGSNGSDSDHGTGNGEKTETQFFPEALVFDPCENQKHDRNDSGDEYPGYGGERYQVHRFPCGGFKRIPDHVRVDENTQIEHKVIGGTGGQQQAG